MTAKLELRATSGGYVILNPQDTAVDVPLTIPASGSQLAVADANGNVVSGGQTLSPQTGFKNRIINGGMVIDQRNAGAALTMAAGSVQFPVDRTLVENNSGAGTISAQQVSDAPTGFTKSLKVTVTVSDSSLGATDRVFAMQKIEGYNIADLGFGTASPSVVTLSFWVKSSLTGTFGGVIISGGGDYSYPFAYTINSANTWEYKTITFQGSTAGTFSSINAAGISIGWSLGVGATYSGPVGSWANVLYLSATGAVDLMSTLNATWQITGVQLEKGSSATAFEFRSIGQEEILCKRYYARLNSGTSAYTSFGSGAAYTTTAAQVYIKYPVTMRATPTFNGSNLGINTGSASLAVTAIASSYLGTDSGTQQFSVASGLSGGQAVLLAGNNSTSAYIDLSSEL